MMSDNFEREKIKYEHDKFLHQDKMKKYEIEINRQVASDKMSADIGLFYLKIILTINSGGLAYVIAIYGRGVGDSNSSFAYVSGLIFIIGLVLSVLCAGSAYFYQSLTSYLMQCNALFILDGKTIPRRESFIFRGLLTFLMIFSGLFSFVSFIIGSYYLVGLIK